MTSRMPKPRPPHLHRQVTRHGKTVWYVRKGKGARIRINEDFGTPAFKAAYEAALQGHQLVKASAKKPGVGTVRWAVGMFKRSSAWAKLKPATRKQRENILVKIIETAGDKALTDITRETIVAGRERRKDTPAAARHFVDTMRSLFAWALDENLVAKNPAADVVARAAKTEGHAPWTPEDVAAYQGRWPIGTRERVAFDVLYWTGLRRGDAVVVGRQHVRNGVIRIKTEKTDTWVAIYIEPELQASIDAGPCGDLTFIAGVKGLPRVKESFGEWFRTACHAAAVHKSAHGIRKAAATRDAENGYTEAELEAKYGWTGGRMASHYTRAANRERLSIQAAERTSRRQKANIYSLTSEKGEGRSEGKSS